MYILATMAFKTNFLNVYHLFNEASISAFYFTIFLKIMPQTSIPWADISNICRYIIIFTWALNVLIVLIENLAKVIEKLNKPKEATYTITEISDTQIVLTAVTSELKNVLYVLGPQ